MSASRHTLNRTIELILHPLEGPLNLSTTHIVKTVEESESLWKWVKAQPIIYENDFIAWKLCYVIYKTLQEGPPSFLKLTYDHRQVLKSLGIHWKHSFSELCLLILQFCKLIVKKARFHQRFPAISGDCHCDVRAMGAEDPSTLFYEQSIEIFNLLDSMIDFKNIVLNHMTEKSYSSSTPMGQMRVEPFIEVLSDCKNLYTLEEKLMAYLHRKLSYESLDGHRQRFSKVHKDLKLVHNSIGQMSYFKKWDILTYLPEKEPIFISSHKAFIMNDDSFSFSSVQLRDHKEYENQTTQELLKKPLPKRPIIEKASEKGQVLDTESFIFHKVIQPKNALTRTTSNMHIPKAPEVKAYEKPPKLLKSKSNMDIIKKPTIPFKPQLPQAVVQPRLYNDKSVCEPKAPGFNTIIRNKDNQIKRLESQNDRMQCFYHKQFDDMQKALKEVQDELTSIKSKRSN